MTIAPDIHEKILTIDEFMQLPDIDDERSVQRELVDGRIVEVPVAGEEHGLISSTIYGHVWMFNRQHNLGRVTGGDTNYVINEARRIVRAPDVSFISNARRKPVTKGAVPVPPDLLVEVMSDHDYEHPAKFRTKMRQYQDAGVALMWVVKPREKMVEVYHTASRLPVALLTEADELNGGDILPGFVLKVNAVFDIA